MSLDEVGFTEDGTFVDLNIGQHLRNLGFGRDNNLQILRRLPEDQELFLLMRKKNIYYVERKLIIGIQDVKKL